MLNKRKKIDEKANNYILLGEHFYLKNKKTQAIKAYEKSLDFELNVDRRKWTFFNLAHIYSELSDQAKAIENYKEIISLDREESGAYYGIAILYEDMGFYDDALLYYNKAIDVDPEYDRAYFYGANLYDSMGKKDLAIDYYQKAIELVADDYIAYNNIGAIYEELGQYNKAKEFINKAIEINPNYDKAYYNLGVIYKMLNKRELALDAYDNARRLNPKYGNIYLNISEILIDNKEFNNTINLLTEGIKNNPHMEELYYNRACCYSILGENKKALADIKRAIEINPAAINDVRKDPDFANLKDNIEFNKIIKEI